MPCRVSCGMASSSRPRLRSMTPRLAYRRKFIENKCERDESEWQDDCEECRPPKPNPPFLAVLVHAVILPAGRRGREWRCAVTSEQPDSWQAERYLADAFRHEPNDRSHSAFRPAFPPTNDSHSQPDAQCAERNGYDQQHGVHAGMPEIGKLLLDLLQQFDGLPARHFCVMYRLPYFRQVLLCTAADVVVRAIRQFLQMPFERLVFSDRFVGFTNQRGQNFVFRLPGESGFPALR